MIYTPGSIKKLSFWVKLIISTLLNLFFGPKKFWVDNKVNAFCSVISLFVMFGLLDKIVQNYDVGKFASPLYQIFWFWPRFTSHVLNLYQRFLTFSCLRHTWEPFQNSRHIWTRVQVLIFVPKK